MKLCITTSWDDGHKHDKKLAALLKKYGIAATFYIAPEDQEFPAQERLSKQEIRDLDRDFEIGAHTVTHPRLATIDLDEAQQEITASKRDLEKITGHPITSFCYPGGNYNTHVKEAVRQAGFNYARTVERFWSTAERGAFDAPTTLHAYRHWSDVVPILKFARFKPLRFLKYLFSWDALAMAHLDDLVLRAAANKSNTPLVYHLWGHSWEVEKHKDWRRLERVLSHIAATAAVHPNIVQLTTNAQIAGFYSPKKRLLLASSYAPPHPGGLEHYMGNIAQGLMGTGEWEVHSVTTGDGRNDTTIQEGIITHYVKPTFKLSNSPIGLTWPWQLRRLVTQVSPDIINAHMPIPGLADCVIGASGSIPSVVTFHTGSMRKGGSIFDLIILPYEKLFLPRTLGRADWLIASSEYVQGGMLKNYHEKTIVVPPGAELERFTVTPKLARNTILFVGNYSKACNFKGMSDLLEAAAQITPRPRVKVVGYSDITSEYVAKAQALGLGKNVEFIGILKGQDLVDAFHASTVLALPSLMESYPTVIAEALASGLPAVAYDTGGIKEMIVNGHTGYVVPQKDIAGLAKALGKTLQDYNLAKKMGQNGSIWARQRANWSYKVADTELVFNSLINGDNLIAASAKASRLHDQSAEQEPGRA